MVQHNPDSATDWESPAENDKKKIRPIRPFLEELGKANFEKSCGYSQWGDYIVES